MRSRLLIWLNLISDSHCEQSTTRLSTGWSFEIKRHLNQRVEIADDERERYLYRCNEISNLNAIGCVCVQSKHPMHGINDVIRIQRSGVCYANECVEDIYKCVLIIFLYLTSIKLINPIRAPSSTVSTVCVQFEIELFCCV